MSREFHNFAPVFNEESRILILGSFPSVASRAYGFYYGHPRNRFWELVARIVCETMLETIEEKRNLILRHHIALWDVCASCEIRGSSDASIVNVVPNDIPSLLARTKVSRIYTNGATAHRLFCRSFPELSAIRLPSTSPANAAFSLDRLASEWRQVAEDRATFG